MPESVQRYMFPRERSTELASFTMPAGAQILPLVGLHDARVCMWAKVDRDAPMETRIFGVYESGDPLPESGDTLPVQELVHCGSFMMHQGMGDRQYPLHVFEIVIRS